jgi:hypothetical protein
VVVGERERARCEVDERARVARRVLEEARRDLAPDRSRGTLTAWLLALLYRERARDDDA